MKMFFTNLQNKKYAEVMVWAMETARKNGKFKPYDTVLLRSDLAALPLAQAVYQKLLEKRYHVITRFTAPEAFSKEFYLHADDKQLTFVAPGEKEFQGAINGLIALRAPQDLTHLKQADPARLAKSAVAHKPLREILDVREQQGFFPGRFAIIRRRNWLNGRVYPPKNTPPKWRAPAF